MADNFFISKLRFDLEDGVTKNLNNIENSIGRFARSASKTLGGVAIGSAALSFARSSINAAGKAEEGFHDLGITLGITNDAVEKLDHSVSKIQNKIPLTARREYIQGLADSGKRTKELAQNNDLLNASFRLSQTRRLPLSDISKFISNLTKSYKELKDIDVIQIVQQLGQLSPKALKGISSISTEDFNQLKYFESDITKLTSLLAILEEQTDSSGSGLQKLLGVVGGLQGEKGDLLYASLGIVGTQKYQSEFLKLREQYPQISDSEIGRMMSITFPEGFKDLVRSKGGDFYGAIKDIVKQMEILTRDEKNSYALDLVGQENLVFLRNLTSKDAIQQYNSSISNLINAESELLEKFNRSQQTLNATLSETAKLMQLILEKSGKILNEGGFKGFMNDVNENILTPILEGTVIEKAINEGNFSKKQEEQYARELRESGKFINPFRAIWNDIKYGYSVPGGGKLGILPTIEWLNEDYSFDFTSGAKKNIEDIGNFGGNFGISATLESISKRIDFFLEGLVTLGNYGKKSNSNTDSNNTVPLSNYNYSPVINIYSNDGDLINTIEETLLNSQKLFETKRLDMDK